MSRFARRWGVLVAGAVVVTSLFPALAPAQGTAGVPVTGGSWYWQEQVGSVEPPSGSPLPPVAPPGALPTPDVPPGDFPVAVVAGQPDKESFLQLDSSAIPTGSTVTSLVLTMHEDAAGGNTAADTATVEARAVTGFLASGDSGKPWANRPAYDTSGPAAAGKRTPEGWTFELAPIAARWTSGELANNGIALVPAAPVQGQTYEVVWFGIGGAKPPTVSGSVTPAATTPSGTPTGESVATDTTPSPISIAPTSTGDLTSSGSPSFSTPSPSAATATPRQSVNTRGTPVRRIASAHRAPPWSFFLVIVVAIALIGASTLTLGDLGEPEPDRRGGVLRALERREEVPT